MFDVYLQGLTINEFCTWELLQWIAILGSSNFFTSAGGMGPIAATFYRRLPPYCLTNYISPTIRQFTDFVAAWVSPCLDQWLCV